MKFIPSIWIPYEQVKWRKQSCNFSQLKNNTIFCFIQVQPDKRLFPFQVVIYENYVLG